MALSRPPDYTKVGLVAAGAIGLAYIICQIRKDTLPHTGDNIRSFPHGGRHTDGCSDDLYIGPNWKPKFASYLPSLTGLGLFLTVLATLIISNHYGQRRRVVITCFHGSWPRFHAG
nr:triple gene block protein 2 [Miscanthus virus M]